MYNVFIQKESTQEELRSFVSPYEAEKYFYSLCERRTDVPASVILANNRRVKKKFHIAADWSGERVECDECAVC